MVVRPVAMTIAVLLWASSAMAGGRLEAEVAERLKYSLPWDPSDVEVTEVALDGHDPGERYDSIEVKLPPRIKGSGKVNFQVALYSKGRPVKGVWASARVTAFRDAVVALKPLRMNHRIGEGDVVVERVAIDEAAGAVASLDELKGMVVKRPVSAGSAVKRDYLKPETVIRKGDFVVLNVENDKLKIKSNGVATGDGHMGGAVTVKTSSGRDVTGKVTGPGEITINF